jgi:hypothetical protein
MKTFDELLDLSEFDGQSMMAKYIHHGGDINNFATTWEYVSFTYSLAFDELARKAYQPGHRVSNLCIPLFFLARHSIELALKGTIPEYADDAMPEGHDLVVFVETTVRPHGGLGLSRNGRLGCHRRQANR